MAIKGAEPRGGQRLVDRGPGAHPGVAGGGGGGVVGQRLAEARVEERGPVGAGAVVDEANSSALEAADRATTEAAGLILVPEAVDLAGRTTISLLATAMRALISRPTGSCLRRLTSTDWLS